MTSKLLNLTCDNCKKEFQKFASQIKTNKTVFCSNKCVINYRKIHTTKIDRNCIECGKSFKIHQSEIKKFHGTGKYCSKKCAAMRSIILICVICGKEFKSYKSELKRGKKRFCSVACYNSRINYIENFFNNIKKTSLLHDCWIWKGKKDKDGYGIMHFINKNIRAHRLSYIIHKGKIKDDLLVCHICDNPPCVNPNHLWLGTNQENMEDMMIKRKKIRTNWIK